MAVTFVTTWPAALTNTAWQKKKSFLDKAKSKTKTGLGDQLVKAEAAWKLVKFSSLDAAKIPLPRPVDVDNAKIAAQTHLTTVAAAASRAAIAAAAKAASTKNNSALSSTAKKAAADIEKGLLAQAAHIRDISLTDFDTAKADLVELTNQTNLSTLKKGLSSAEGFIKQVETDPTRATFNSGVQAATRPMMVALGNLGAVNGKTDPRPLGKDLGKWADGKDLVPAGKDASEEKVTVLAALRTYKKAIAGIKSWSA